MTYCSLAQYESPIDNYQAHSPHRDQCDQSNVRDLEAFPCHQGSLQTKPSTDHKPVFHDRHNGCIGHAFCYSSEFLLKSSNGESSYAKARVSLALLLCAIGNHMILYVLFLINPGERHSYRHMSIYKTSMSDVSILLDIVQRASRTVAQKSRAFGLILVSVSYGNYTRNIGVTV